MDVIEARRRILMNAPHIVTPTSSGLVNFSTDMKAPLKECKVHFSPVQEGTGDPSPENVRPITGWTGVEVCQSGSDTNNPTTIPLDWTDSAGTVYGGYVDLVTGEIWAEWTIVTVDGLNVPFTTGIRNVTRNYIGGQLYFNNASLSDSPYTIADRCTRKYNPSVEEVPFYWTPITGNYFQFIVAAVDEHPEITNADEAKEYTNHYAQSNPFSVCYKLATPILLTTLTPTALKTLIGTNNIWSNANGNIDLSYWTH